MALGAAFCGGFPFPQDDMSLTDSLSGVLSGCFDTKCLSALFLTFSLAILILS